MKVTKYALVIGAALGAVSAHAQFGATSKADLEVSGNKQGVYLSYSPFARASGGGSSSNGYLFSVEKAISEGKNGPNVIGGFFTRVGGGNLYQINYRSYIAQDASVAFGILGGDGFSGKNDFSVMYLKDMPKMQGNPLTYQLGGGLYYDSSSKGVNFAASLKASYPIQSGFSLDASFWYFHQGGDSVNLITLGVGYRM